MKSFTIIAAAFTSVLTIVMLGGVVPRLLSARSDVAFAAAHGIIITFLILGIISIWKFIEAVIKEDK